MWQTLRDRLRGYKTYLYNTAVVIAGVLLELSEASGFDWHLLVPYRYWGLGMIVFGLGGLALRKLTREPAKPVLPARRRQSRSQNPGKGRG